MNNKSPLRYPGGKTRACKKLNEIIKQYFDTTKFTILLSPFFGGGSFEFFVQNQYNYELICNDKFKPLYSFWKICKEDNEKLCTLLYNKLNKITKDNFSDLRNKIMDEDNKTNDICVKVKRWSNNRETNKQKRNIYVYISK